MFVFYVIGLLPVFVGLGFFLFSTKFNFAEWVIVTVVSFGLAFLFQELSYFGLTTDYETWSGQIVKARHNSAWQEYYETEIDRTEYYYTRDSSGKRVRNSREVFDHWESRTRWHPESFHWWSDIGTDYDIDGNAFNNIKDKFGDLHPITGERSTREHNSRLIAGDPNDYISDNRTGYIQPVTKQVEFENRIKAAGSNSVFSFEELSDQDKKSLYPYPVNGNYLQSDRVIGEAKKTIDLFLWDQMNSRIGPKKKVNVIIIGFASANSLLGQKQEALYLRGRKNDLVLCYGEGWTHVFGWTEAEIVKDKLGDILTDHKVDNSIIPLIEDEITADYVLKSWKKFDYIAIEPPSIYFLYYFIALIIVEAGVFFWALNNGWNKKGLELEMSQKLDELFGVSK